jgi:hypothetical protein
VPSVSSFRGEFYCEEVGSTFVHCRREDGRFFLREWGDGHGLPRTLQPCDHCRPPDGETTLVHRGRAAGLLLAPCTLVTAAVSARRSP